MTLVKIAQLSSMSKVLKVPGPGIQVLACSLPLGSHFSTSYLSLLMLQPYTAFYSCHVLTKSHPSFLKPCSDIWKVPLIPDALSLHHLSPVTCHVSYFTLMIDRESDDLCSAQHKKKNTRKVEWEEWGRHYRVEYTLGYLMLVQ